MYVPQNANNIELCLCLTNGKMTLAPCRGSEETRNGFLLRARSIAFASSEYIPLWQTQRHFAYTLGATPRNAT